MQRVVTTLGGIAVVFDTADQQQIDRQLKQLDRGLFLTRNPHPSSRLLCWEVRHWVGSGVPPPLVLVWAEEDGTPRTLSTGVVYATAKRRENFGRNLAAEAQADNDRKLEQDREDARAERDWIVSDMGPHITGQKRSVLFRTPGLVASRRRRRAEGEVC